MITLNNINLSSIDLSGIDLRGIKLGLGGRGGGSSDGFPVLPGDVTRWHFGGLTNEMMAAMDDPRIEDADHKGRFLSFKNFAWAGMSGVGGYKLNWSNSNTWANYIAGGAYGTGEITNNTIHITSAKNYNALFETRTSLKSVEYKVLIKGLTDDINLRYGVFNDGKELWTEIKNDGIYTLPSYDYDSRYNMKWKVMSQTYPIDCDITIEQLPIYPGALVFDGVDDYGVCDNFPILTKEKGYTVVALRQRISTGEGICGLVSNVKNWFKDGAFILEYSYTKNSYFNRPVSFGAIGGEKDLPHILTYQTSKSYNGVSIAVGSFIGTDRLYVGKTDNIIGNCTNAAIWELVILDHDATGEELTKIKDYFVKTYPWLFPDQAWTVVGKTNEDEDRATIANITGNGNDLVLSNFGFAKGSGYGLYAYNFNSFELRDNVVKLTDVKKDSFRIIEIGDNGNVLVLSNTSNSAAWKIRITGMKEGDSCIVGNANKSGDYIKIIKDGIYTFQKQYAATSINGIWYNSSQEVDVLVEQIPEYEGYLVTDGLDDKITSSAFKMGKDWTVVGDWKFINDESKNAGIIKPSSLYVYNALNGVSIFINSGSIGNNIKENKGFNAICSNGRAYDRNWTEYSELKVEEVTKSNSELKIGASSNDTTYTRMAFKNFAIYPKVLSKDDCIKAYNYLQTLKAK